MYMNVVGKSPYLISVVNKLNKICSLKKNSHICVTTIESYVCLNQLSPFRD